MRRDPPFDQAYLYATWLLEMAERQGARVFNRPQSLRDFNEKLAIARFPQFIAPTLVTGEAALIREFLAEQGDIIVKPLNAMGGAGIFRLRPGRPNLGAILETVTRHGAETDHGPALPAGDQGRRQAHPGHRRRGRALLPGAHPDGRRDARQSGRRRHRRGPAPVGTGSGNRLRPGAGTESRRPAAGGPGRDRRLPDRGERHQPHLFPGNHRPDRLRCGGMFVDALESGSRGKGEG
jgi:hypothetical protein